MRAGDVTETLNLALQAADLDQANVFHRPRLLSDNGSSYISGDLAKWLKGRGMQHSRGAPYHPMTQGKIERWHQTLKNRILLEHYWAPRRMPFMARGESDSFWGWVVTAGVGPWGSWDFLI